MQNEKKIGLMLAKRRETLAKACKGRPDLLLEEEVEEDAANRQENVTPLTANQN